MKKPRAKSVILTGGSDSVPTDSPAPTSPSVILSEGEPNQVAPRTDSPEPQSKNLAQFPPHENCAPRDVTAGPVPAAQKHEGSPSQKEKSFPSILRVVRKIEKKESENRPPRIDSFADFLLHHARVKSGPAYVPYHFHGREALEPIVAQLDSILESGLPDASLALCGGAQFGKTVLMLNLLAYLVAVKFRNVGYYLPDDDLVSGLVDGKLRPDVLGQVPWLAHLIAVGKTLTPTGRAVNRKGAFLCTDGARTALAFMRGLGKIPTSFSMDVVIQDEKDDLPEEHARFLSGRMTASNLRLSLIIGTQRYHGAGQNLAFTAGSQHIGLIACPGCAQRWNPETQWPGICRLRLEKKDEPDPKLTVEGNFLPPGGSDSVPTHSPAPSSPSVILSEGEPSHVAPRTDSPEPQSKNLAQFPALPTSALPTVTAGTALAAQKHGRETSTAHAANPNSEFRPSSFTSLPFLPPIPYALGQKYYLACPACGTELDRAHPEWHAQAPEKIAQRRFSYRLSQLLFPDIDLAQIVAAWQLAIRDPAQMNVFCTDRLALPRSSAQTLTPAILEAARARYALVQESPDETSSLNIYGGLDLGDQCWFVARSIDRRTDEVRLRWVEAIAAERVRSRVPELFRELKLTALCVDAGPLRDLSRDLAFLLNDLDHDADASGSDSSRNIFFSRGGVTLPLCWQAASERWLGVRCAPVEFTQREGQGLRHKVARTQDGRLYPLLGAHRDESIQRVISELWPAGEAGEIRVIDRPDGTPALRTGPRFRLPRATQESRGVLDLYERHLLAGSRQEPAAHGRALRYLDQCENHFLLATAYAALAELLSPPRATADEPNPLPAFRTIPERRRTHDLARGVSI